MTIVLVCFSLVQLTIIGFLLWQLDKLQNKLMARDYSEYAHYHRHKSLGSGGNFMQESISKAYKNNKFLAGEGMEDED